MNLEEKIMADRQREDWVWVRLREGFGSSTVVIGPMHWKFEAGKAERVTRAEWDAMLKDQGILEETDEPQRAQRAQSSRTEEPKTAL